MEHFFGHIFFYFWIYKSEIHKTYFEKRHSENISERTIQKSILEG